MSSTQQSVAQVSSIIFPVTFTSWHFVPRYFNWRHLFLNSYFHEFIATSDYISCKRLEIADQKVSIKRRRVQCQYRLLENYTDSKFNLTIHGFYGCHFDVDATVVTEDGNEQA